MSLITRVLLLVLAVPFALACGGGQFKYVPYLVVEKDMLSGGS